MVLEVLEAVKWVVCLQQLKNAHPHQDRCETHNTSKTDSISSFDSGFEGKIRLCCDKIPCHPHVMWSCKYQMMLTWTQKKQLVISSVFCRLYFAEISNDFTTIISTFYNNVQMLTLMNAVGVI